MNQQDIESPWNELARLVVDGDVERLAQYLWDLPASEIALGISRLSDDQQRAVFKLLGPEQAAAVFEQLPEFQAVELIENLDPAEAAQILDELPSDEQADLIAELDLEDAEAILAEMDPTEAAGARSLSAYDDDEAGGLMVTEFLKYQEELTVGDVIEDMRARAEEYRDYDVQYAYVCDPKGRLTGVLRLRDLLLAPRTRSISNLMISHPISVHDHTSLDDLADFFDQHHYLGVPVTSADRVLLGIVRQASVAEAWGERMDSDFLKTQGIVVEEIRTMPLLRRSSRRLAWLSVNIVLNVIAASVIALFTDTLSSVIALAVFLPIISDMSGCSGNQAVAVSLRELSLGLVRPTELFWVWWKEVSVGLLNGLALGILIAIVAYLWQGNAWLGVVVGVAMAVNTIIAVSIGGIVPLVLKRFNVDPAVASGPLLTTVTDMCGFFLVLGLATIMLAKLT